MALSKESETLGSHIDPAYSSGRYFGDPGRFSGDASFKVKNFLRVFLPLAERHRLAVRSYADVGCGAGAAVKLVGEGLRRAGFQLQRVVGYDVSPHTEDLCSDGVEFIHQDFCQSDAHFDLVTLFDVFEHVPAAMDFLGAVSARCKFIGLHIPLDASLNVALRNMFREKLHNPGHLIALDCFSALNLLALSGLRVLDYDYTLAFLEATSHRILTKLAFPLRYLTGRISPWLLSKTLGGVTLVVVAATPSGLANLR